MLCVVLFKAWTFGRCSFQREAFLVPGGDLIAKGGKFQQGLCPLCRRMLYSPILRAVCLR